MKKRINEIRTHLSWIKNQILLEPLNKGRKMQYLLNYFNWHLFYKYRNKRWIISFDNNLKSIVYPYPDHDGGEVNIWTRNVDWHELEFIRKRLEKGDSMIDAGCNLGNRTLALADVLGRAILIDAGEVAVRRTRENIELNELSSDDFKVVHAAIGETTGEVYFTNLGGASTINRVISEEEAKSQDHTKVAKVTIDSIAEKYDFIPDFIKIDVEGQDLNAIKGALSTLKSKKTKLVLFEHNQTDELQPILDLFQSIEWEVFALDKSGNMSKSDELIQKNMNLFAQPIQS